MKKQMGVALCLVWAAVFCLAGSSEAVKFRCENLGTLGGSQYYTVFEYREAGINDVGQVVGYAFTSGGARHAFVKSPGQAMVDLGDIPGSTESHATGINHNGIIGGWYRDSGGDHACAWSKIGGIYQRTDLGVGTASAVYGVNEAGYLVGYFSGYHACVFPPGGGAPHDLGALPGQPNSLALGINSARTIVGYSADSGNIKTACVWSPSGGSWTTATSLFGVANSAAFAINNSGQAVGYATISGNPHAVLKSPGHEFQDLGILPSSTWTIAYDINDSGWVVGSSGPGSQAFLWTPAGGMQNLNDLVVNPIPGLYLTTTYAINKHGEIVGYTQASVYKLTPIITPPYLLLLD
jgi:probable HAF family extracellular repeat protein